ncbi:MAG: glycoside hydrolase family 9 protein, partial [Spirochaetota bacterium]
LGQSAADKQAGYIVVVYRIFLKVPADRPLRPGRTYTLSIDPAVLPGAAGLPPISSLSAAYSGADAKELIHANQEAWPPVGPKVAYLSAWLGVDGIGNRGWIDFPGELPAWDGSFSLVGETGDSPVFTARIDRSKNGAEDYYAGSETWLLDFSAFTTPGRYRLRVPGVGYSHPFSVGAEGFDFVVHTVMRGMMQLRDGDHGLDAREVTRWNRPPAHLDDAIEESTGAQIDLEGGHMDAGDREKIPLNMALASSYYLVASRLFPDRVKALGETLQIPESGNGIPDYLDELFYELDSLYKMVANTHGDGAMTAWIKPAKGNFEKGLPLEGATGRLWSDGRYGRLKSATLAVAGALAMAATDPLVKAYSVAPHPDRAAAYLRAAELAWSAYSTHEYDNSYWYDDSALNAGAWRLGKHPYSSELIFAAANLLEATGRPTFLDHLQAEWPAGPLDLVLYKSDPFGLPLQDYLSVALGTQGSLPAAMKRQAREWITQVTDAMDALPRGGPVYGIVFQGAVEGAVGWFFSGVRTGFPNLVAWGLTGDLKYRDRLVACWNYLLGANPLSLSHISGL